MGTTMAFLLEASYYSLCFFRALRNTSLLIQFLTTGVYVIPCYCRANILYNHHILHDLPARLPAVCFLLFFPSSYILRVISRYIDNELFVASTFFLSSRTSKNKLKKSSPK